FLSGTPRTPGARLPDGLSPAVDVAQQFLGVPYLWGGESPAGFDCSGLVQYVYGQLGVDLPRTAAEQARAGQPVAGLADARPGDLLAFGDPVDHIGIYAGNGLMVVAPKTGDVVKVQAGYDQPTPSSLEALVSALAHQASGLSQRPAVPAADQGTSPEAVRPELPGATTSDRSPALAGLVDRWATATVEVGADSDGPGAGLTS